MDERNSINNIDTSQVDLDERGVIFFDEKEHTYTNQKTGEQYLNFSTFWELDTLQIVPDLPHIRKAAEYGKTIHRYLQEHLFNGTADFIPEVAFVEDYLQQYNFLKGNIKTKREKLIYNHDLKIAGTCDLLIEFDYDDVNFEKRLIIADYKTGKGVKKEQWISQLAFYSLMFPNKIIAYLVFHLPENEEFSVIEFSSEDVEKEKERILRFLTDRKNRNEQALAIFERSGEVVRFKNFIALQYMKEKLKLAVGQLDDMLEEDKQWSLNVMLDNGVKNILVDNISMILVNAYEKPNIDTTLLKKEMPEIAEQYTIISEVKASLRVKLKEKGDKIEQQ